MGTLRSTFIADKNGTIIKVWEKVTSEGHAEEVLEFLKNQSL
jgi:peroxiredoxin Q/BCP